MSTADEELWLAFREEVGEQLDNLDMELLRGIDQCDIHQVFRDFHTIKSSCAMLDLTSMKELAHISEDYLDLVRKGAASLDEDGIDALLTSVETLKRQLVHAVATRSNPEPADSITQSIHQLIAVSTGAATAPAGAASPMAVAVHGTATGPDPEFVELAQSCSKAMRLLSAAATLDAPLKNALIEMANMADLMDFPVIKALARDIIKTLGAVNAADAAGIDSNLRLLHDLMELLERIRLLESLHAVDCAAADAECNWRRTFRKPFLRCVLDLLSALDAAGRCKDGEQLSVHCDAIAALLDRLAAYSSLCGFVELASLFRYVAQVIRSIKRGYFDASPAVFAALGRAIDHPYAVMLEEGEAALVNEIVAAFHQLEAAVSTGMREEPEHLAVVAAVAPVVDDRFRSGLDTEGHELLGQLVNSGRQLFEIDLDMTREEPVVEELLEWISQHGTILHNISSFTNAGAGDETLEQIRIVFLVAFDKPLDAVRDELLSLDPQAAYFRIREHAAGRQHAAVDVAPAANSNSNANAATAEAVRVTTGTMRIDSHALDELVTELGEIVMLRNLIGSMVSREKHDTLQRRARLLLEKVRRSEAGAAEMDELKSCLHALHAWRDALRQADQRMQDSMGFVQQKVLDLREMPLSAVLNRLPNIARKQAQACGRKVELKTAGGDWRIDKGMIEWLLEPLVQLVCNAIEHGIEPQDVRQAAGKPPQGCITVSASVENGMLSVAVADDGAGIDVGTLQARAEMRQQLGRIGGTISVANNPGAGAVFTLTLPQSVAMQDMLLVRSVRGLSAIPERHVTEALKVPAVSIQYLQDQPALSYQHAVIPVVSIDALLSGRPVPLQANAEGFLEVAVIGTGQNRLAVAVRQIEGTRRVFVPEPHPAMASIGHVGGVTLLGDGSLVYILNIDYLMENIYSGIHALYQSQAGSQP